MLRLYRKRAAALETRKQPARVTKLSTHAPLHAAISAVTESRIGGSDAVALAKEVVSAPQMLERLIADVPNMDPTMLHFILSNSCYRYFIECYLAPHFSAPMSPLLHDVLFPMLRAVECRQVSAPTVILGWRECGKSAGGAFMMPIHSACHPFIVEYPDGTLVNCAKDYTVITSLIKGNASKRVQDISTEFKENDKLRRDFGEFYYINGHKPDVWNKSSVLLATGQYFEAGSRRTAGRGLLYRLRRPNLYIVDDVEDPEATRMSKDRREADFRWLIEEVVPAVSVDKGNVLFHGNAFDERNLAMRLYRTAKKEGWQAHIFRIYEVDENGQMVYTWPERFGPEFAAAKKKELVLESAWQREYMQNPTVESKDVSESDAQYYNLDELKATRFKYCRVYIACDPAISKETKADFTAIVPIAFDPKDGTKYVLPIVRKRGMAHDELVNTLLRLGVQYRAQQVGIETVSFQTVLKQLLETEARRLGITRFKAVGIKQPVNMSKTMRIERLWVPLKQGTLKFLLDDEDHAAMIYEIVNAGGTDHDDAADACEMADRLINEEQEKQAQRTGVIRFSTS